MPPVDNRPTAYAVETQLALIRRDIEEIHCALHGDGKGRKGLLDQVEELVTVADRGRFSLRLALWLGGGVVAAATGFGAVQASCFGTISPMTTLHLTNRLPSASNMTAPYTPPIASDVVIDLSHWQSSVDFVSAKSAGIAAVILKATQGSRWIDATFAMRFNAANAAGLLVGAYHFLDNSPPEFQVENLLSVAGDCRLLALDAEPNGIGGTVTVAQAAEAAARLHMATGRAPLVYIGRYGPDGRGTGFPNTVLSRCPLWLPAYNSRPICPLGWSRWALWQHTDGIVGSDAIPVPGIGRCDRSRFAGTVADLKTWWDSPHL